MVVRPAVHVLDLVSVLPGRQWTVIGQLATEDRATAVPLLFSKLLPAGQVHTLIELSDANESPWRSSAADDRNHRWKQVAALGKFRRVSSNLHSSPAVLLDLCREVVNSASDSIIIDISAMPKRLFFPLVRVALSTPIERVRDVIVTYTAPAAYASPSTKMSFDPAALAPLPTFGPMDAGGGPDRVVVAVGFQQLGLRPVLESSDFQRVKVTALVPVPSPLRHLADLRHFIEELRDTNPRERPYCKAIPPNGMWNALGFLNEMRGKGRVWLLPYGPKPIALAMAVAAIRHEWPAYYTQPLYYRPDYSTGVRSDVVGRADVSAYGLRIGGTEVNA